MQFLWPSRSNNPWRHGQHSICDLLHCMTTQKLLILSARQSSVRVSGAPPCRLCFVTSWVTSLSTHLGVTTRLSAVCTQCILSACFLNKQHCQLLCEWCLWGYQWLSHVMALLSWLVVKLTSGAVLMSNAKSEPCNLHFAMWTWAVVAIGCWKVFHSVQQPSCLHPSTWQNSWQNTVIACSSSRMFVIELLHPQPPRTFAFRLSEKQFQCRTSFMQKFNGRKGVPRHVIKNLI